MMSLQLHAQGGDGLFQNAMFVTCGTPKLLYFSVVRCDHLLHLLTLGTDSSDVLLKVVMRIDGSLLEVALLFTRQVFKLLPHGGNCVAHMSRFVRDLMGRAKGSLLFLRLKKLQSGAHFGDRAAQAAILVLGLEERVELSFSLHETGQFARSRTNVRTPDGVIAVDFDRV